MLSGMGRLATAWAARHLRAKWSPKGNGTQVGLFLPLPPSVASQFPDLGAEDTSPPHVTLLYVGAVPAEKEELFVSTLRPVLAKQAAPIIATLSEPDYVHPDKVRRVWHSRVRFSKDVAEIRDRAWLALEEAGFAVEHSYPLAFFPHVTLAYVPDANSHAPWGGPVPKGSWEIRSVAVWGLREPVDLQLGTFKPQTVGTRQASKGDQLPGGKGDEKEPSDFDPEQLARGKKVEREHTDDPALAEEIAMDHLTEDPDYYVKLKKVDKDAAGRVASRWLAAKDVGGLVYQDYAVKDGSFGDSQVGLFIWRRATEPYQAPPFVYSRMWTLRKDGKRVEHIDDGGKHYYAVDDRAFSLEEFEAALKAGKLPKHVTDRVLNQPRFHGAEWIRDVDEARFRGPRRVAADVSWEDEFHAREAWPKFTLQVNRQYKSITLTTYLPHAKKKEVPRITRFIDSYFNDHVRPALAHTGYTAYTASSKMYVNSGVGDKEVGTGSNYGILILSWKLEAMAEDNLVTVVEEAFRGLGPGAQRLT